MNKIEFGQIWKHHKGQLYKIVAVAYNHDELRTVISYQNINGGDIYWHYYDNFIKKIDNNTMRFEKID